MNKEVEIKFKVGAELKKKLSKFKLKPYKEEDEYFLTKKMFDEDTYLRFRKKNGKIFLQLKDIILQSFDSKDVYKAKEYSTEITKEQYKLMKNMFNKIFPIKSKVVKIRYKGFLDGCEICYDKVKGIGEYLEIEGPRKQILKVCKKLGLNLKNRYKGKGYAKMALKLR